MPRKRWRSIFFWTLVFPVILLVSGVVVCNVWIVTSTRNRVHDDVATIEPREVGVVLGTSKKTGPDTPNRHFENRMAAAAALYREGKVGRLSPGLWADFILVDRDPLLATPAELRATKVFETWVGGKRVWAAKTGQ
jgi:hypothetical protein